MPATLSKIDTNMSLQSLMLIAFATTEAIASVILLSGEPIVPVAPPFDVLNDNRMIAFCLIGSVMGGLVSIIVFPPKPTQGNVLRALSLNFLGSSSCGVLFAPALVEYHATNNGGRASTAIILAGSGALSIFAIMILTMAANNLAKLIEWFSGGKIKIDQKDIDDKP
jgi:hypothetical protein